MARFIFGCRRRRILHGSTGVSHGSSHRPHLTAVPTLGFTASSPILQQFYRPAPGRISEAAASRSIRLWWDKLREAPRKDTTAKKEIVVFACYVVWNIWKERNGRTFEKKNLSSRALAGLIGGEFFFLRKDGRSLEENNWTKGR